MKSEDNFHPFACRESRKKGFGSYVLKSVTQKLSPRTKREPISVQRQISCSVLIRVSEKSEILQAQHEQAEKHRPRDTFFVVFLVVLHRITARSEFQTRPLNRAEEVREEIHH